jgi:alginate O-acetyltransferase complex protein AlgI
MTWFRDYLYKPMHKKGAGPIRVVAALYVIYFVSGFWHGAAWTFVAWSVLNWKFVAIERLINSWPWAKRITRPEWTNKFGIFRVIETVVVVSLFSFAGIYFRSRTMAQAHYVMRHLFDFPKLNMGYLASLVLPFTGDYSALAFGLTLGSMIVLLEAIHLVQESKHVLIMKLWQESSIFKGACLIGLALIVLFFGNFNSNSFVYFQF